MGEVNRRKKHLTLRIKRAKREKVHRLLEKLQTADARERTKIIEKIGRVAPYYPIPGETLGRR